MEQKVHIPSRKARALLAYLALNRDGQQDRGFLANLLWPDTTSANARTSLRQALFEIRKSFGAVAEGVLTLNKDTVELKRNRIWTDVDDLLTLNKSLTPVVTLQTGTKLLKTALAEFEDIGPDFADWIAEFRNLAALETVSQLQIYLARTDISAIARRDLARVMLALDEFNEVAVRHLMRALYQNQESAAALSVYADFYKLLDDQLAAEPSAETQDLAVEIKLSSEGTAKPPALPAMPKARSGVVILPFEVLSDRTELRFVSLGLLDEVTCRLASNRMIPVVASNSTRRFLGNPISTQEVSEMFKAKYGVFGSLRPIGHDIAISTQVVDLESDNILHAHTAQRVVHDAVQYEVELAALIANQISPSIDQAELNRTRSLRPTDLEPYHLLLRAKDLFLDLSYPSFTEAGALLDRAIALSPTFGPAHSLKADWYALKIWQRWSTAVPTDLIALERHATKAIEYSPSDGRSRAILAHNRIVNAEDFDFALRLFDQALSIMPNDSETLIWTVPGLAYAGDTQGAIRNGLKALELSPLDPFASRYHHFVSLAYYAAGAFEDASAHGRISYDLNPNHLSNLRTTIASLWASERMSEVPPLVEHHQRLLGSERVSYPNGAGPPFRDPAKRDQMVAHLSQAGLPV